MKSETTTTDRSQNSGSSRRATPAKRKKCKTTRSRAKRNGHPPHSDEPKLARVTASGLVTVSDVERIERIPLHYYAERGRWYGPNSKGGFVYLTDSQAKSLIAEYGFNKSFRDEQGNTLADRVTLYLIQNKVIAYAGLMAGYRSGIHKLGDRDILVTQTPTWVKPEPGHWPVLRGFIESLLSDAEYPQIEIFHAWLSASYRAFWTRMTTDGPWPFHFCPGLALFGPKGCGKTALIDLILTPLLGGSKADPMNYLRKQQFNKDLIGSSLLVLDDKGASSNLAERRERGERIKDLIWKEEQRMEGKGVDALMLRPFWRLVIAGNDDDAGLQVCPALSPSLEDKLILLRAQRAEGLPSTHHENEVWAATILKELPAFAAYLLGYTPPESLALDTRSRVATFWHPDLVSALRDMQPEMRLLELIDSLSLIPATANCWEGSASDFERTMREKDNTGSVDRLFPGGTSAGRMLSELARVAPERVTKSNHSGTSHYRIYPPKAK